MVPFSVSSSHNFLGKEPRDKYKNVRLVFSAVLLLLLSLSKTTLLTLWANPWMLRPSPVNIKSKEKILQLITVLEKNESRNKCRIMVD